MKADTPKYGKSLIANRKNIRHAICDVRRAPGGFSLIELLVVASLIIIMGGITLVYIDPVDSGKRARDEQRATDLKLLETALEHYIADKQLPPDVNMTLRESTSSSASANPGKANGTGWIPVDISKYIEKLPVDPINGNGNVYRYYRNGAAYKLDAKMEHYTDIMQNTKDGGNDACHYETGSNYNTITLPNGC